MNQGPPQTLRAKGKWGLNGWAPGHTKRGRREPPADRAEEGPAAGLPKRVTIATARPASAWCPPAHPRGPPTPRGPPPRRDARGHSPGPAGGLASHWRAHSAPVVAEPGIPHLGFFRPAGQPQGGGRGPPGDKVHRPAQPPLPAAWLTRRGTPGALRRPREQLL